MSRFILTAAEIRAAEAGAVAAGTPAQALMERAGTAAAEAIRRFAGPLPAPATMAATATSSPGGSRSAAPQFASRLWPNR
jgi:hypothetical protein